MLDAHVASAFAIGRPFAHEGEYDFQAEHVTNAVKTDAQVGCTRAVLVCMIRYVGHSGDART